MTRAQRCLSLAEFALGSAIVIGHNVYHVIPNEVPILFVIGLISLRVRDGGWGAMGLPWPDSWRRTVLIALGAAAVALRWLLIVWTFVAFGEEISYRGYLLTRAADVGARSKTAYWVAVLLVSMLFGIGHYYKGPAGMVDSGMAGLVLGTAYMLSGRKLWACILAHGFIDTFGVIALFFGWQT